MNSLTALSPSTLRKAADIKEQIEKLQRRLNDLLGRPDSGDIVEPGKKHRGTRGGRAKTSLTINAAILQTLEAGPSNVATIADGVIALRGKASKPAISQGLAMLKKEGKISNIARGQYARCN